MTTQSPAKGTRAPATTSTRDFHRSTCNFNTQGASAKVREGCLSGLGTPVVIHMRSTIHGPDEVQTKLDCFGVAEVTAAAMETRRKSGSRLVHEHLVICRDGVNRWP